MIITCNYGQDSRRVFGTDTAFEQFLFQQPPQFLLQALAGKEKATFSLRNLLAQALRVGQASSWLRDMKLEMQFCISTVTT